MNNEQIKYVKKLQKLYIQSLERIDELEYERELYRQRLKDDNILTLMNRQSIIDSIRQAESMFLKENK